MTNTRYRLPVILSRHDVEVPKHLDLYKKQGVGVVSFTRLNSRQLFMARLTAKCPPTADQLRKRRDVMAPFAAEQKCPECQKQIVLDKDDEPSCIDCQMVLYPPPSAYLTDLAGSYLDATHDVRSRSGWSSRSTRIFMAHHAAELYLKALGACSAFANDSQDEYLYGDAFSYDRHNLNPLLDRVCSAVRARLCGYLDSSGRSIEDLVNAIPKNTSGLFRYGVLLRDARRREVRTTVGGDIVMEEKSLSTLLDGLCDLLDTFTKAELNLLGCYDD